MSFAENILKINEGLDRRDKEIERLRAALQEIADLPPLISYNDGKQIIHDAEQKIARTALNR